MNEHAPTAIFAALSVAGLAIVGTYTFAYFAHVFFTIVEATSGGQDEITWPDEPIVDRLGKAAILVWMIMISLIPGYIVGQALSGQRPGPTFLIAASIAGLVFPVVLLSVQSVGNFFYIINPPIIKRLMANTHILAGYYIAAMITWLIGGASIYGLKSLSLGFSPIFSLILAWAMFTMARLIGRLSHKMSDVKRRPRRKVIAAPSDLPHEMYQQRERPAIAVDEADGYGLRSTDAPIDETPDRKGLPRLWIEADDDGQPIAFQGEVEKRNLPKSMLEPSEYEMQLAGQRKVKPPDHLWTAGTFTFAMRPSSWGRLAWIAVGIMLSSWLMRPILLAT